MITQMATKLNTDLMESCYCCGLNRAVVTGMLTDTVKQNTTMAVHLISSCPADRIAFRAFIQFLSARQAREIRRQVT